MKVFRSVFASLLLSAVAGLWFAQSSVNAYWQQTYHRESPLEILSGWTVWAWGAQLQAAAYGLQEQGRAWLDAKNERLPANVAAREAEIAAEQEQPRVHSEKKAVPQSKDLQNAPSFRQPEKTEKAILRKQDEVFFAGDSMMQGVAPFVQQQLKRQYGITSLNLSRQSTGLSYPSLFDWPKTVETTLDAHRNIRLLVMFLGANDPWDFPAQKSHAYLKFQSSEWEAEYISRVNRILTAAQKHQVQVMWLGIPFMKRQKLDMQMRYLNRVLAQNLQGRVLWLPTAHLLSNGAEQYSDSVEIDGKMVRYRTKDGIHFSPEGQELLAESIMQKIDVQP